MNNPTSQLLSRPFKPVPHASFDAPATQAALFPPGEPLPALPPAPQLSSDDSDHGPCPATLSREDERRHFLAYNYARHRAALAQRAVQGGGPAGAELALWAGRADHLREFLVRSNLLLVPYAFYFRRKQFSALDPANAFSDGSGAVVRAVDKFDADLGIKFSSYAVRAILNQLSRDAGTAVRRRDRLPTVALTTATHTQARSEQPADDDAAERLAAVRRALDTNAAGLSEAQRTVFVQRFMTEPQPTLEVVGASLGLSKERARQLQRQALVKLRTVLVPAFAEAA